MHSVRKGVSPIISTVLIIAFVVAVANIVAPWIIKFTKERSQEVEDKSEGQVECIYSSIDFDTDDIDYSLTGERYPNSTVNITVTNSGSEPLHSPQISLKVNKQTYSYQPTTETNVTSSNPLSAGTQTYLITNITDNLSGTLKKVRIVFRNCPNNAIRECDLVNDECQ